MSPKRLIENSSFVRKSKKPTQAQVFRYDAKVGRLNRLRKLDLKLNTKLIIFNFFKDFKHYNLQHFFKRNQNKKNCVTFCVT